MKIKKFNYIKWLLIFFMLAIVASCGDGTKTPQSDGETTVDVEGTRVRGLTAGEQQVFYLKIHNDSATDIRDISLENLKMPFKIVGDKFPGTGGTCGTSLAPGESCTVSIESNIAAIGEVKRDLILSYKINGSEYKKNVELSVTTIQQDIGISPLVVWGQKFSHKTVKKGLKGEIEIFVTNRGLKEIQDLTLELGADSIVTVEKTLSNCIGKILSSADSCSFILKSTNTITKAQILDEYAKFKYKVNNQDQDQTEHLSGVFDISQLKVSGNQFGSLNVESNAPIPIKLNIENLSTNSIDKISLDVTDKQGIVSVEMDPKKSTCLFNTLTQLESCQIIILAKPTNTINNFSTNVVLSYRQNGQDISSYVELTGDLIVAPATTQDFLTLHGNLIGSHAVSNGDAIKIELKLSHSGQAGKTAQNINIARRKTIPPPQGAPPGIYYAEWDSLVSFDDDATASTCHSSNLANGTCTYTIYLRPLMNADPYQEPLVITYTDAGVNKEFLFDLKGTIAIDISGQAGGPPTLSVSTAPGDPYFAYSFRERKIAPPSTVRYSLSLWDNVTPAFTFGKIPRLAANTKDQKRLSDNQVIAHMPWSFKASRQQYPVLLKDIIPDRIVDPVTQKRYVKLYHGTRSAFVKLFENGANAFRYDVAGAFFLGKGVYLSSSANESKMYACQTRKSAATGESALLIVGVEENNFIKGMLDTDIPNPKYSYTPRFQATKLFGQPWYTPIPEPKKHLWGDPIDPAYYFARDDKLPNQFVFFSNIKPYLKIFEIILLGDNFGMSQFINDFDGLAEGTAFTYPNNFKCKY